MKLEFYMAANSMRKQNLLVANPILANEWHPTNNGKLTPADVVAGSGRKLYPYL